MSINEDIAIVGAVIAAGPGAYGWRGQDGAIRDCIAPDTHCEQSGAYTIPLYAIDADRIARLLTYVERLEAALAEAKRDAEHLRSESVTLAGILRDCDAVLVTIEPESTTESDSMADLRRAIAYALDPYGNTDNLPGIEPRRRIVFACPVCAASLERTP